MNPARGLVQLVASVLERAGSDPKGAEELRRFNHVFQFRPGEGEPFYVRIASGEVSVEPGEVGPLPYEEMEVIRGDTETLQRLFSGEARLVDLGWDGRLNMALYGPKMHITAWLNRLIKIAYGRPLKLQP